MPAERLPILIAEDDAEIRHLVRERLEGAGYPTFLSRTGREALAALDRWTFCAIVLDINMPELNGFSVLKALKTQGWRPPVLMLTARQAAEDVRLAISLGAKDYLTKPFTEAQLMARMRRLLKPVPEAPLPIDRRPFEI